ncbi:hypothetical protein GGF46_003559 [Coemansia sp. RSA 552]|nr:hypothetical protein GGF46_003559 [Coemansia sp. RSA 552]
MSAKYSLERQSLYESGGPGTTPYPVRVYKHQDTEFRVVVCQVPGPVCHMALCLPTLCADHKGKPHTLEHMVFCGSEKYPYLGYIDAAAAYNLGQPMNASTHSDMTMYKFTGLGQEGAANMLPVVLDHVMHPLIQDNHFATEVYHIDQEGRQQGVILSEMSDFAYEERSVRSHALRQMLYPPSSTYAWECGGLPQSIESLTTQDVVEYHRQFYTYDNTTLLLVGAYDERPDAIFDALEALDAEISATPPMIKRPMPPPRAKREQRRNDVAFASERVHMGTMAFAWEGPPVEDVEAQVALEMLIDYMTGDPASPLRKRFTNRPVPIAGDIQFRMAESFPAMIELSFSEVPLASYMSHAAAAAAAAAGRRRDTTAFAMYPSPADAFGPIDLAKLHDDVSNLFASNYYKKQLISTLMYVADHWLKENWLHFRSYLAKQTAALATAFPQSAMKDRASNGLLRMLARDAIAYRLSPASTALSSPQFGSYGRQFSLRQELAERDCGFWQALVQRWFLKGQMVHVAMIPDPKLGIQIEAERNLNQRNRIENMTSSEIEKAKRQAAEAFEQTKRRIPSNVLAALPPTPDISKIRLHSYSGYSIPFDAASASAPPFALGRMLVIPGEAKAQFQISLPLTGLKGDLQPYLPLVTSLLKASSGLIIPRSIADTVKKATGLPVDVPDGMPFAYLSNDQLDSAFDQAMVKYDACIGSYAGQGIRGIWPDEVLTLYGSMRNGSVQQAFTLLVLKLLFGEFSLDTVLKTVQAQVKELKRLRGTGSSLLIDTFPWLRIPGPLDARAIAASHIAADARTECSSVEPMGRAINLYFQTAFLSTLAKSLSADQASDSLAGLRSSSADDAIRGIRAFLANCTCRSGLVHVSVPCDPGLEKARGMIDAVGDIWNMYGRAWVEALPIIAVPASPCELSVEYKVADDGSITPPRKRQRMAGDDEVVNMTRRTIGGRPGSSRYVALKSPLGIHLALANLQTSYVGVQIPIDSQASVPGPIPGIDFDQQLESLPERDSYALQLLINALNRTGGPIKNAVRGRGYAYGVGIHPRINDGYLGVYISHAVDPQKALEAFWETLNMLESADEWSRVMGKFQLDAARSMLLYRRYTDMAEDLALEDAHAVFLGFSGIDQKLQWMRRHVEAITLADLRRAFLRYFTPFISKSSTSALYIVATPQAAASEKTAFLTRLNDNPYNVCFKGIELSMLDPVVHI